MALSSYTRLRLTDALTSSAASADVEASVLGREAVTKDTKQRLDDTLGSDGLTGQAFGDEVANAIVSGDPLSHEAKRKILIALADERAGNELINFIQSSPTAAIKL